MIPLESITKLPETNCITIPESYLDEMGHMNIQWYFSIFDRAAWRAFDLFGADLAAMQAEQMGVFALEQHIRYLAEVRVGQTVRVYSRFLARNAKRLHFIHFMINEDRQLLSSVLEGTGMSIDMQTRRSAPWSPALLPRLDALIAEHQALDWEAPVCGAIYP